MFQGPFDGFPDGSNVKESAGNAGNLGLIPGWGRSPGEGNDDPSNTLAWKTSWIEVPHSLQPMGSERVRQD